MLGYFAAMFAEFVKLQLLRSFHLIFGRNVIPVFANSAGKSDCDAMLAFFRHVMHYTRVEPEFPELTCLLVRGLL